MPKEFLREIDHWVLALLHQRMDVASEGFVPEPINAGDFATMLADYVLLRVAEDPRTCWSACGLEEVSDAEILHATTFTEDMLAAGLVGAVCELSSWQGDDGVGFMLAHGVPPDDANDVAAGIEVVSGKLGERGQSLIQQLVAHHALQQSAPSAA